MMRNRKLLLSSAIGTIAALSVTAYAQVAGFGGDKIKLPAELGTLYTTVDRADNKQFREYYANTVAMTAKKGEALPSGSVLTGVLYKAKLDEKGAPRRLEWVVH